MPVPSNTRRPHVSTAPTRIAHARDFESAYALARDGRLDEFAAVAFGLPDLNRIEPPASPARRRAPAAAGPYAAAARVMARDAASEAVSEASALFPNMNRLDGDR